MSKSLGKHVYDIYTKLQVEDWKNVFQALADANVNVDMIVQSAMRNDLNDIAFTVPKDEADNALEVLKLNPNNGTALMLIGKAYANSASNYGEDDFDHASVFWAAVDKFQKAKQVDPAMTEEADKLIGIYSQHFPSKDEAFFRSVTDGATVKIGSWINESTKARFRK